MIKNLNRATATVVMETLYAMSQDKVEAISKPAKELLQAIMMEALKALAES